MFDKGYSLQEYDKEQALAVFRQAAGRYLRDPDLSVRSEAVKCQLNVGVLLRKNGRHVEAIDACKSMLDACAADTSKAIRDNLVNARICMGRSYAAMGDKREAVQIFREVLALPADAMEVRMRNSIQKEMLEAGGGVIAMVADRLKSMFQRK
jgi:tetratricopeptide (TPR) repeat protein